MRLVRHLSNLSYQDLQRGSVVTIGSFDGLHLGHEQLLKQLKAVARDTGALSVVMSFEPTPKEFFQVASPPARLTRFREKFEALEASGVDIFYCPRFSSGMRDISAADFIRRILVHGLNTRCLVIGDDFRFARRREGGFDELTRSSAALGYTLQQVPSVVVDGIRVSSTAIREACAVGDMAKATALLGRPYRMSGKIVRGEKLGRELGFPTANVDLRRRQSAVLGIFAVRVHGLAAGTQDGVANVGTRPTFDGDKPLLEVYLFDFNEEIYGQYIHVEFIAHLREEVKYDAVDQLVAQMHVDAANARSILAADTA